MISHVLHLSPPDDAGDLLNDLDQLGAPELSYSVASVQGLGGSSFLEITLQMGAVMATLAPGIARIVIAWLSAREKRSVMIDGQKITLNGYSEAEVIKVLVSAQRLRGKCDDQVKRSSGNAEK
jgi:hypothetical protein